MSKLGVVVATTIWLRTRMRWAIAQGVEESLAAASRAQWVPLRVYAVGPWFELLADDRSSRLSDGHIESLQRVLAPALGLPGVSVRRLSDKPAWRREATWQRAWAPAPLVRSRHLEPRGDA